MKKTAATKTKPMGARAPRKNRHRISTMDFVKLRAERRESQQIFWGRFGVEQSTGSRYEIGRALPGPLALLISLWLSGVVDDEDLAIARSSVGYVSCAKA